MKVGVISDTHLVSGGFGLRKAAAQLISKSRQGFDYLEKIIDKYFSDVEKILHAGDLVDLEVLELLEQKAPVEAVRGNMDSGEIARQLPIKKVLAIEGRKIGLIHGWGAPTGIVERIRKEFDDKIEVIVFGHTHSPMNTKFGDVLFFNPGSPIDRRFAPYNSIGILHVSADSIEGEIIKLEE